MIFCFLIILFIIWFSSFLVCALAAKGYADALRMQELRNPEDPPERRKIPLDSFTLDNPQGASCIIHAYTEAELFDKFSRPPYAYDYHMIESMWADGIPLDVDPHAPEPARFLIPPDMKTQVFLAQERWKDVIDYEAWVGWRDPPPRWRPKTTRSSSKAASRCCKCGADVLGDDGICSICKAVTFERTPPEPYFHHGVHVNFDDMTTDKQLPPPQYDHRYFAGPLQKVRMCC